MMKLCRMFETEGTLTGWMTCHFTPFLTYFSQNDGNMKMKDCVQWYPVNNKKNRPAGIEFGFGEVSRQHLTH